MKNEATNSEEYSWVVIDFEWNQPIPWLKSKVPPKDLPGEIIEIGAVKLVKDGSGYRIDSKRVFRRLVRPVCYTIMNRNVSQVTQRVTSDLGRGADFVRVYEEFREWCGPNAILCGWSGSDLPMLKSNLAFHGLDTRLRLRFMDVQRIFSLVAEGSSRQRSVEYAVDFFRIPKKKIFHEAYQDAYYTAGILAELLVIVEKEGLPESGSSHTKARKGDLQSLAPFIVDPDIRTEISAATKSFSSWAECVADTAREQAYCPACGAPLKADIVWFSLGRSAFSLWQCEEHFSVYGRMRMKKTPQQQIFGALKFKIDGAVGENLIREKKAEFDLYGEKGAPRPEVVDKERAEPPASS